MHKIWFIIGMCLIGVLLLTIAVGYIMLGITSHSLKKKSRILNILTAQKLDFISTLCNMIEDNGGKIPDEVESTIHNFSKDNLKKIETKERITIKDCFNKTIEDLYVIFDELQVSEQKFYLNLKASIEEIDALYRKQVILYNTDVDSYNYWVKYLPNRLFNKLFKVKFKEKIN